MTLEEFAAEVCERLRADMQSIRDPEGDVHPALFHYFQGETIRRFKIPRSWFDSRQSKDAMARAIEQANRISRPHFIGWTTTTYIIDSDEADAARAEPGQEATPIHDIPGRKECVVLLALSHDESRYYEAEISRDGRNPPGYADWIYHGDATDFQGYVIEPIMRSMRSAL